MIVKANHIYFAYQKKSSPIVKDFHISIETQERVGLVAPSGYGKTTVCKILAGYLSPQMGEVTLDNKPLASYKHYCPVQLIFQHPEEAVNPRLKMRETLAEGDCVEPRILQELGIESQWLNRFPHELSGGELQRFCIARALGKRTKFILTDEITTMLDLITQSQIWNFLLKEIHQRGIGLLVVSHSDALLDRICTRKVQLKG